MPLFEVETDNHIIITWASDEDAASVTHRSVVASLTIGRWPLAARWWPFGRAVNAIWLS
jgi:hypothetical protein